MVFRKVEGSIQKRGGRCSERRRVLFRKEEGVIQKVGGLCSENCEPWFLRSVEAICGEFRHMLVVSDIDNDENSEKDMCERMSASLAEG